MNQYSSVQLLVEQNPELTLEKAELADGPLIGEEIYNLIYYFFR